MPTSVPVLHAGCVWTTTMLYADILDTVSRACPRQFPRDAHSSSGSHRCGGHNHISHYGVRRTTETDGVWSLLTRDLRSGPQSYSSLPMRLRDARCWPTGYGHPNLLGPSGHVILGPVLWSTGSVLKDQPDACCLPPCSVLANGPRTSEPARPQWSCDPRTRPLDYWARADGPARCVLPASLPHTAAPTALCAQATDLLSAGQPDPAGPGCRPHAALTRVLDGHLPVHAPPACLPRGLRDARSWTTCQTLPAVLATALTCSVRLRSGLLGRCRWATWMRAAGHQSRYCGPPGCALLASSPRRARLTGSSVQLIRAPVGWTPGSLATRSWDAASGPPGQLQPSQLLHVPM
jgi:hypothetical protein